MSLREEHVLKKGDDKSVAQGYRHRRDRGGSKPTCGNAIRLCALSAIEVSDNEIDPVEFIDDYLPVCP